MNDLFKEVCLINTIIIFAIFIANIFCLFMYNDNFVDVIIAQTFFIAFINILVIIIDKLYKRR